ncbi:MAG: 4Fe-4S binding protein, partial [Desulfovibrionales bacterium]
MLFRRVVQAGFWLLFVAAVAVSIRDWAGISPLPEFVRLDPLLWLGAFLSSGVFPPGAAQAGVVILSALFLGRFFCSHICPLGASMDALSTLSNARVRRPPQSWRRGKYVLLIALLAAALWGENLTHWGSPLSLATRLYTLVLWPFVHFLLLPLGLVPAGIFPSEPARVDHLTPLLLLRGTNQALPTAVPR